MSSRRRSGLSIPLFSMASSRSWGIGEFLDLPLFAKWLGAAGQAFVQILPINEVPEAETSPYSSLTAMALDPIYISLPSLEDFEALGGEGGLSDDDKSVIDTLRAGRRIEHRLVRAFKSRWLRRSHERFVDVEQSAGTERSRRFTQFTRDEAWWLDDYTLFRALRKREALRPWWEWPEPFARRHGAALAKARIELRDEIGYLAYAQWVAAEQWTEARRQTRPLQIFGDLPFMISADSPDVWTQQNEFRFDATVGVPPDAFSETGQDWGLPPWRWDVMAQDNYEWMGRRARRSAALYDGFRLDHLVGLYRTYIRPLDQTLKPFFAPDDEMMQLRVGERLVGIYQDSGAEIVAEDLGTVPDFVRRSLQRMGVPGIKVFRWERHWTLPGQPFVDPPEYNEASVATTGTHDTEPLAVWWENIPEDERELILRIPSVLSHLQEPAAATLLRRAPTLPHEVVDAVIQSLLHAGSRLTIIPVQDVFGWRDRINTPAQIDDENWSWRLQWPVDRLDGNVEARVRAEQLADWCRTAGRVPQ